MEQTDSYKTITKASPEVLFKDRNSKFFGYAFPVSSEDEVKTHLDHLKKQHHQARHWCYAYQFGMLERDYVFRANDDGEPGNSAGMPIYGQIQSFDVTNILVAVVRIFGGTKLGVGGLISAYKETAKLALTSATIIKKVLHKELIVQFDYAEMDTVMRLVKKHQLTIVSQELNLKGKIVLAIPKNKFNKTVSLLKAHHKLEFKENL